MRCTGFLRRSLSYFISSSALVRRRFTSAPSPTPPFDVLFFGSDDVSLPTLKELYASQRASPRLIRDLQVVAPIAPASGKHATPLVKAWAAEHQLAVHQPSTLKDWALPTSPDGRKPNVAIVASFGMFIPAQLLEHFGGHTLNMHPSLLPKYRGAAPIYHTVLNGDHQSGVTILRIHPTQFDAGDVLYQTKYDLPKNAMYQQVRSELSVIGAKAIVHTLSNYSSLSALAVRQPRDGITLAPKIKREQTQLNWHEDSPVAVLRRYRAFADTLGVFTFLWDGSTRVKIEGMEPVSESSESPEVLATLSKLPAGQITFRRARNRLLISCQGGVVAVTKLKVEGKNSVDAIAFANGYLKPRDGTFAFRFVSVT